MDAPGGSEVEAGLGCSRKYETDRIPVVKLLSQRLRSEIRLDCAAGGCWLADARFASVLGAPVRREERRSCR
jgi:hypothetical protein